MVKRYIIIPGCCDLNRGDQALGWETKRIAEDAGYIGSYSILAEDGEPIIQSEKQGYEILTPVLGHPSRRFKNKDNINYSFNIQIKWGIVAILDFIFSFLLLIPIIRVCSEGICRNRKILHTLKRFKEADAIFMKGGGLIQSHGGILSTYATYYRLYHILLASSLNKPIYIMPNSFGPFKGPMVRMMTRYALKRCKLVTARETYSKQMVKNELGINIECYPDLAFFLPNANISKDSVLKSYNLPRDKKLVAITMRPYRFPNSATPEQDYIKFKSEISNFIEWLYSKGYMPVIIEHTLAITSHENDGDCIKDVVSSISDDKYKLISSSEFNCYELKRIYSYCDYIVGTRFHSMIFALSNMVPGIAISYDGYKSVGIMKDIGLDEFVIDIKEVSSIKLQNLFDSVIFHDCEIKEKISDYLDIASRLRQVLVNKLSN